MEKKFFYLLCFLLPLVLIENIFADITYNDIKKEINDYLASFYNVANNKNKIIFELKNLDSRLKLKDCNNDLTILNQSSIALERKLFIKVSCSSPSWSIYVPILVKYYNHVLVSTKPLVKGKKISYEDVELKEVDIFTLNNGYFNSPTQVVNMVMKKNLFGGHIITPNHITPERLIHKNNEVTIISTTNSIQVRDTGIALKDGRLGEKIHIRNKRSNKIIEAFVSGPGEVTVNLN